MHPRIEEMARAACKITGPSLALLLLHTRAACSTLPSVPATRSDAAGIYLLLPRGIERADTAQGLLLHATTSPHLRAALVLLSTADADQLRQGAAPRLAALLHLPTTAVTSCRVRTVEPGLAVVTARTAHHLVRLALYTRGQVTTCYAVCLPNRPLRAPEVGLHRGLLQALESLRLTPQRYRLVVEPRQHAFRLCVPQGWTAHLEQAPASGGQHALRFALRSPDGKSQVVGIEPHVPGYVLPGTQTAALGLAPGASYAPVPGARLVVARYQAPKAFLATATRTSSLLHEVRVQGQTVLPSLGQLLSRPPQASPDLPAVELHGEAALFAIERDTLHGELLVTTQRYWHPRLAMGGWLGCSRAWLAPPAQAGNVREAFEVALATLEINPWWWRGTQARQAASLGQALATTAPPYNLLARGFAFRSAALQRIQAPALRPPWPATARSQTWELEQGPNYWTLEPPGVSRATSLHLAPLLRDPLPR